MNEYQQFEKLIYFIETKEYEKAKNLYFEINKNSVFSSHQPVQILFNKSCQYNHHNVTEHLLEYNTVEINQECISYILDNKNLETVQLVLNHGIDPHTLLPSGYPLIYKAIIQEDFNLACILIDFSKNEDDLRKFSNDIHIVINNTGKSIVDKILISDSQKTFLPILYNYIDKKILKMKIESNIISNDKQSIKTKI